MSQSAEDLRAELKKLEEEERKLKSMDKYATEEDRRKHFGKTRIYNGTKTAIVIIIIYLVMVGTFGSMKIGPFANFSMDDFVKFLGSFSPIFITLTGSIGVGGVAKNIAKGIAEKKNGTSDVSTQTWGEDVAKGGA